MANFVISTRTSMHIIHPSRKSFKLQSPCWFEAGELNGWTCFYFWEVTDNLTLKSTRLASSRGQLLTRDVCKTKECAHIVVSLHTTKDLLLSLNFFLLRHKHRFHLNDIYPWWHLTVKTFADLSRQTYLFKLL